MAPRWKAGSPDGDGDVSAEGANALGEWPGSGQPVKENFSKELLTVMVAFFCFKIFFFYCVFCLRLNATCWKTAMTAVLPNRGRRKKCLLGEGNFSSVYVLWARGVWSEALSFDWLCDSTVNLKFRKIFLLLPQTCTKLSYFHKKIY